MSQHDFDITSGDANAGITMRAQINSAFQALASNNAGSSDPTITYPYEFKVDTSTSPAVMFIRDAANSSWVQWGYIDTTSECLNVLNADKFKVSSNDTDPGYLNGKLTAGENVSLTEVNNGGNETLQININGVPIGTVISYAGVLVPSGYLHCNGTAISRTTYAALYAAIGTVYGVGDGSTTFNLPDYRGLFLRGYCGTGIDTTPSSADPEKASRTKANGTGAGDYVGSYQSYANVSHGHSFAAYDHYHTFSGTGSASGGYFYIMNNNSAYYSGVTGIGMPLALSQVYGLLELVGTGYSASTTVPIYGSSSVTIAGNTGYASAAPSLNVTGNTYESRPINRSIMYCIKY